MRLLTVVGARPQFIKAAVVGRALAAREGIEHLLIHTGQHFDPRMSAQFFDELAIKEPDYNLAIAGGPHGQMTGRMLEAIEQVFLNVRPDGVLVYGDTNSTLAGALAAAKLHIPIYHVEAGLRSFNRRMPEEVNRVLTDHLSALLFCPTETSMSNLKAEGVTSGLHLVGDVMYDATLFARASASQSKSLAEKAGLASREYVLLTLHRAENTDDPGRLAGICRYIENAVEGRPVVFPVHPRTRQAFDRYGLTLSDVTMVDPVGYMEMNRLLAGAALVMTDSGGLQKEAYFHRKPCITLREETEWVETIEAGWNRLWRSEGYQTRREIEAYGDGHAGDKIVQVIENSFN